ncbi:unnamed protein product [Paramecium sonneborni]|uniref:Uncharacterized protein n=1 Tax=Paramecium sonneborni TaxID=65129 RepID=A0A8S1PDN9_9CILI|nr:unnamed protein product [Paramecium sonneborni]
MIYTQQNQKLSYNWEATHKEIFSFVIENYLPISTNLIYPKLNYSIFTEDLYENFPPHYLNKYGYDDINALLIIKAKQLNIKNGIQNLWHFSLILMTIQNLIISMRQDKNWLLQNDQLLQIKADGLFMIAARYDNLAVMLLINNNYNAHLSKSQNIQRSKQMRINPSLTNLKIILNYQDNLFLFQALQTKQQKIYLSKQMIQRIYKLKITTIDQMTILSNILLTLHFVKEKQFQNEAININFNMQALKKLIILIQFEQCQY